MAYENLILQNFSLNKKQLTIHTKLHEFLFTFAAPSFSVSRPDKSQVTAAELFHAVFCGYAVYEFFRIHISYMAVKKDKVSAA